MCGRANFKRYSIGLKDCPWISKQRIDELLEEYKDNLDHPLLRSTLYGEFMDFSRVYRYVCEPDRIQKCLASPPSPPPMFLKDPWASPPPVPGGGLVGDVSAFCDFAGGIAENVLAIRRGNVVTL